MKAALPRFRKARELNAGDPRATLYLALTVESLGQTAEAMSLYEEAVRRERSTNDLHAETLLPGAKLLFLLGRLGESESWLTQAAKLSPNSRDVHFELARLLLEKGDAQRAAGEGETALVLSEGIVTDAAIRYLLIRAYQKLGMADRAAMHAETMRTQESPAGNKPGK
jgi:tetratricopeptide (TPR) repeat protein